MSKDNCVTVYIQAYNAEKTLHRSIESILSQTHKNFTCWVCDNGSNDKTMEIIETYALRDSRIIPFNCVQNDTHILFTRFLPLLKEHYGDTAGWFCNLDADDEYTPDFLERMLAYVTDNNLDAAVCGTDWIDEKTGEVIRKKAPDRNIILEGKDFAKQFPVYRNFMVTIWGAIYSIDLLRRCDFAWSKSAMNFGDTAFAMETFRRAKRAGILSESLHRYYLMPKALSCQFNPNWFQACKYLHKISKEYLLDYGEISKQNADFLCVLFLILIKYILPRIQNADVDLSEKLSSLNEIFNDEMTQYMLKNWPEVGIYSDKKEFLREINDWITAQDGWMNNHPTVEKIISSMNN